MVAAVCVEKAAPAFVRRSRGKISPRMPLRGLFMSGFCEIMICSLIYFFFVVKLFVSYPIAFSKMFILFGLPSKPHIYFSSLSLDLSSIRRWIKSSSVWWKSQINSSGIGCLVLFRYFKDIYYKGQSGVIAGTGTPGVSCPLLYSMVICKSISNVPVGYLCGLLAGERVCSLFYLRGSRRELEGNQRLVDLVWWGFYNIQFCLVAYLNEWLVSRLFWGPFHRVILNMIVSTPN